MATGKRKKLLGEEGEEAAAEYLLKCGYGIVTRNYRFSRAGEIDIIAVDGEYLCFVEVKTRSSILFGMPCEAVTRDKQEKIKRLAYHYIKQYKPVLQNIRFDVIEILITKTNYSSKMEINLIKNAF